MIVTRGLTRRFDKLVAVDNLDVEIPSGRIVAMLGANGAGKTTTLNMLTTLTAPSAGTAEVGGFDILEQGSQVRRILGYVPEHGALYEGLTADEYLELAGRIRGLAAAEVAARATRWLEFFELTEFRAQRLASFSKGMRRKVLVIAALLHEQEQAAAGCTVVYSSHILQQVEELCDHVVLIHQGTLRWQGDLVDLKAGHAGAGLRDIFLELTEEDPA